MPAEEGGRRGGSEVPMANEAVGRADPVADAERVRIVDVLLPAAA